MSEFEAPYRTVIRLLHELSDEERLHVMRALTLYYYPPHAALCGALLNYVNDLAEAILLTRNPPVAPAEQSPSCSDIEPCS